MMKKTTALSALITCLGISLSLSACTKLRSLMDDVKGTPPQALEKSVPYPHTAEFKQPNKLHGQAFYENQSACIACHTAGTTAAAAPSGGGSAGKVPKSPSCNKCHSTFPHDKDFAKSAKHGEAFMKDRKECQTCHGADNKGGKTNVTCLKCHEFPHSSDDWSNPERHGNTYENQSADSKAKCEHCHGEDSAFKTKYPDNFVSCSMCHTQIPHPAGYTDEGGHKDDAKADITSCEGCHKEYKRLLPNYGDCNACHDVIPKKEGQTDSSKIKSQKARSKSLR